jgi:hypothetical protein
MSAPTIPRWERRSVFVLSVYLLRDTKGRPHLGLTKPTVFPKLLRARAKRGGES